MPHQTSRGNKIEQDVASSKFETQTSNFDRINAILVSSLVLVGFLFTVMFLVWMTNVVDFSRRTASPHGVEGSHDESVKVELELEQWVEPGVEEFPEVQQSQLARTLKAVTSAVSQVRASERNQIGFATHSGPGQSNDPREIGIKLPQRGEYQRWKISYQVPDIETYAKMLDLLEIELGVVHQSEPTITRISDLAGAPRITRSSRERENRRRSLAFLHQKQRMKNWDLQLATNAGVSTDSCFTVQFYSSATRKQVRSVEAAALFDTGKQLDEVLRTHIKVVAVDQGYQFQVTGFEFR